MASIDRMSLLEILRKSGSEGDVDFLKEALNVLVNSLMDAEVASQIGAERYERNQERNNQRNGYRDREWDTRVGTLDLKIPKLRKGSYYPSLLEPRKRAEKALLSVVQEAYIHGVSTRKVDDLIESLGMRGISRSEVSAFAKNLMTLSLHLRNVHSKDIFHTFGWMRPFLRYVRADGYAAWRLL